MRRRDRKVARRLRVRRYPCATRASRHPDSHEEYRSRHRLPEETEACAITGSIFEPSSTGAPRRQPPQPPQRHPQSLPHAITDLPSVDSWNKNVSSSLCLVRYIFFEDVSAFAVTGCHTAAAEPRRLPAAAGAAARANDPDSLANTVTCRRLEARLRRLGPARRDPRVSRILRSTSQSPRHRAPTGSHQQ